MPVGNCQHGAVSKDQSQRHGSGTRSMRGTRDRALQACVRAHVRTQPWRARQPQARGNFVLAAVQTAGQHLGGSESRAWERRASQGAAGSPAQPQGISWSGATPSHPLGLPPDSPVAPRERSPRVLGRPRGALAASFPQGPDGLLDGTATWAGLALARGPTAMPQTAP